MNTFKRFIGILASTIILFDSAYSTGIPNTDHPTSFLGPSLNVRFTNRLVDDKAYSLAGEAGLGNIRLGATYAWKLSDKQRIKASAEYLWQDITYAFYAGNSTEWVNQGALGVDYQYDIVANAFLPQFDLSAYGSHAPSKAISSVTGATINVLGVPQTFIDARRIAGSNARGISPAVAITLWQGSRVSAALNYDNVHYNTKYNVSNDDVVGFGGTITFNQAFTDHVGMGLSAAVRQPFNFYSANITYTRVPFLGAWTIGIFGNYNDGKHTLPDTYNVGISADYTMEQCQDEHARLDLKGEKLRSDDPDSLLTFAATPAVYMPQVLAIADNLTTQTCALGPITYLGTPNTNPGVTTPTFSFAPLFSGPNIVYSLAVTVIGAGSPTDFSINPNSGLLTYSGTGGNYNLTVTGSNACSSASVSFNFSN